MAWSFTKFNKLFKKRKFWSELILTRKLSKIRKIMKVYYHGYCGGAKVQVTSQVTGHRPGHRLDHRSHAKTIGHWTKLFLIDILLYKNKTSQGTSIIFFLFWTLPNPTHEKIYSCWSRKEDLRYSVTKVGNEITKVRKITWLVRKNESQNEGLLR